MPGTCTRAVELKPGDTVRADFDGLGHVGVSFRDTTEGTAA
jgi:2-keto-4-pentenoate hydratase